MLRTQRTLWALGVLTAVAVSLGVGSPLAADANAPHRALTGSRPKVVTGVARAARNGFVLHGSVDPGGLPTRWYFIYKPVGSVECEDLEGCGPTTKQRKLSGEEERAVQAKVTHLEPGTAYEYWLVAYNADGTAVGERLLFTVPSVD